MFKLAFHIQKGGVGKTTLSGNTAFALSNKNKKTVLIDCDPQGNSTNWLLVKEPHSELADILSGDAPVDDALIEVKKNLFLIPTFSIGGDLRTFAETKLVNKVIIFNKLAQELEKIGFDYAIYDLSPGMTMLEKRIIATIDEVITPLTPEFFSLDGIEIFNNALKEINEDYGVNVKHEKIVINNINYSFRSHKEIIKKMEEFDYKLFFVRQDRKIAEAPAYHQSIFDYNSESKTIKELNSLAKAIMNGGK